MTVPATDAGAKIIVLESHPAWISAQRQAAERVEAMRRHPSSMTRPSHWAEAQLRRPRP
ncbi:hypothetical protein [Mycobacterium sp. 852002-53434_SCH5985345]|uniref:hypothetical protein n=1 Tax=Mycobacterium sp. 852002-53434_SCH5985345 TaxID=1834107 RepID=UPI000AAC037A|nr:hypothetical protein [Mycobacterium sp. 852002-53434_SCH5985345]